MKRKEKNRKTTAPQVPPTTKGMRETFRPKRRASVGGGRGGGLVGVGLIDEDGVREEVEVTVEGGVWVVDGVEEVEGVGVREGVGVLLREGRRRSSRMGGGKDQGRGTQKGEWGLKDPLHPHRIAAPPGQPLDTTGG